MELMTKAVLDAEEREPAEEIVAPFANSLPSLRDASGLRRRLAAELTREADSLDKVIEGVRALGWDGDDPEAKAAETATSQDGNADPGAPRGMEAVRRIMREGGVWGGRDILDELVRRGWASPNAKFPIRATEAAINRLWKLGELEKVSRGRYRYKLAPTDQSAFDDASGGDDD